MTVRLATDVFVYTPCKRGVIMSTQDYIKFITETFIKRLENMVAEPRQKGKGQEQSKAPILQSWFGLVPFSLAVTIRRNKNLRRIFTMGQRLNKRFLR